MKNKILSMEQDFNDTQKKISKANIALEPRDVYLAYIAKSLCIIADKMGSGHLFDPDKAREFLRDNPGKEKDDKLS